MSCPVKPAKGEEGEGMHQYLMSEGSECVPGRWVSEPAAVLTVVVAPRVGGIEIGGQSVDSGEVVAAVLENNADCGGVDEVGCSSRRHAWRRGRGRESGTWVKTEETEEDDCKQTCAIPPIAHTCAAPVPGPNTRTHL